MTWMNLEPIILSEVSQKEKNKYCILMYICGIYKDSTDEPICSNGDADIENRLSDTAWGRKERAGHVEKVTWKLTSPYVK